jgi:fumarate hydratase class I
MSFKTLLEKDIVELYRKTATELPDDILSALREAHEKEGANSTGKEILKQMLENAEKARKLSRPMCQDTGTPIFYVTHPARQSKKEIRKLIEVATRKATQEVPLRPNAIDTVTDRNIGNVPVIHFEEGSRLDVRLLLKGGGSENVSAIYQLPNPELNAHRNLDGIRRCVLDAVYRAQGKGCPPYFIGVATGGGIEEVAHLSKMQLLRKVEDENGEPKLREFEMKTLRDVNKLGIGPMGLGGKTTAIAVKIATGVRHPATYFVGISIGCWCMRRQSL